MNTLHKRPSYRHIAPVTTREELIYLLSRASELEHGLACVYLFAAYSLKRNANEGGLTEMQAASVESWKQKIASVAVEEMLHLAQVSNLLTAIGGAPHFRRTNFPLPADAFSFGIELSLEPFSKELVERLVCYEMPEAGILDPQRAAFYDAMRARVAAQPRIAQTKRVRPATEPFEVDFSTVGEFYHKIESGFRTISEGRLFIGPPQAQARASYLDLGGKLIEVVDRASACAAIEMIVAQGESPSSEHPDAHFVVFDSIRQEFEQLSAEATSSGTEFAPIRHVLSNPMTRYYDDTTGGNVITDPLAHEVADLFNTAYDTMLLMLVRFFAHDGENEDELRLLARGTLRLMASVLRPLGEALTKLPAGAAFKGWMAGPGFGYNRDVHLLPHKDSAWIFFLERLWEVNARTTELAASGRAPEELAEAAAALEAIIAHLAPLLPQRVAIVKPTLPSPTAETIPSIRCQPNGPYLVANLHALTNSKDETLGTRAALALCRCGGSSLKPYCDGTHARIGFDSSKQADRTADRLDTYVGKEVTVLDNRGTCCHSGNCTDHLPSAFRHEGDPFVDPNGASKDEIISIVRACPSGALGYVDAGVTYTGEEREAAIYVSQDGPYHVRGGIMLQDVERDQGANLEHYALCRCGHSKNKPFCDGSHWYVKFHDEDN
jgi:CDGSH-type Zn-finger protein